MITSNKCFLIPLCIVLFLPIFIVPNVALDTINVNQTITDGDTIISSGGSFELGFFSPGSSKNRYVGIWYKKLNIKTPVWVANRENPLTDSSGILKVTKSGTLVLLNSTGQISWSSNVTDSAANPVAQLLDTGNLVIKNAGDENPENFIWQSFDFPGNTLLDGMKMGKNYVTGQEWQLTSWKSEDDPSPGDYTYRIDTHGYPQIIMLKHGNVSFRVGPWMGDRFSGQPKLNPKNVFQYKFMFDNVEVNYSVVVLNISSLPRRVLSPIGVMQWWTWAERQANWILYSSGPPTDSCDNYNSCGVYGRCNVDNNPLCVCLDKFVAKYPTNYDTGDWRDGCVRKIPLDCEKGDKFIKYPGLKLPDTRNVWYNKSMSLEECRVRCLRNCSCTAYSNTNFNDGSEGSGCFLWFEELLDLRSLVDGEDIYIRMAFSESDTVSPTPVGSGRSKRDGIIVAVAIAIPMLVLCLSVALFVWKKKRQNLTTTTTDGDTIISSGGRFELGFVSPGSSKNRYIGIWYKKANIKTPVWVANRETPITDSSGIFKVTKTGTLVLLNSTSQIIWSSNVSSSVQNPVAQLLDTGNLVIKNAGEENPNNFIWQSFDFPGNTLLDGMKMGKNFVTGQEWQLTSWKSEDDPSPGNYLYKIDTHGYPQVIMLNRGNVSFRVGPWMGDRFSGQPKLNQKNVFQYKFNFSKVEVCSGIVVLNISLLPRRVLSPNGVMQWWTWAERQANWILYASGPPTDSCDNYAICGAYGRCNVDNNPLCVCLDKFVGKYPTDYDTGDWSDGCVRKILLDCEKDKFIKYPELKLPDTRNVWFNTSMSLEDCRVRCLRNCSCTAYSTASFSESQGSGCFLWFEELMDLRSLVDGQDIYIRMAFSESDTVATTAFGSGRNKRDSNHGIIVGVGIAIPMLVLCLSVALFVWTKKQQSLAKTGETRDNSTHSFSNEARKDDLELPLYDLAKITNATDNFSLDNKLGEGGYGTVYKASLEGGQEVAVKRLSKDSMQGFDEFMNEATFIAKLQHRNLVKLLGCCIEAEEKMLIYEYMPNKSLDYFIFDEARSSILDWPTRFHIINGISRGIVYLHQDSRLRIIHRDLKASNILLDIDMNPKIADFGMARSFGGTETAGNTMRVVGTYGYMSPEYQLDGLFSVKSDVFSFGVLVLEIICGRRNRGFRHLEHHYNLIGHAWTLYNEGRSLELVDTHTIDSCHLYETLRCIHVALLCVQQSPEDRPTMSGVVLMLGGEGTLPQPKQPGFFTERSPLEDAPNSSTNEITFSLLDPR